MARKHWPTIYEMCAVCGEPIYVEDERYEMPDGDIVCGECVLDWAKKYHCYGEVDNGYDGND